MAVVRRGAYPNPVEVRRRSGYRMRATVPKRKRLRCECVGPRCNAVSFDGAFEFGDEVLAVSSTFSKPIASLRKGSLTLNDTGDALRIEIALPDSDAAKEILDASEIAGVLVRPFIDVERSDYTEEGDLRRYQRAFVRALIVGSTDARDGWTDAEILEPRSRILDPLPNPLAGVLWL